MSLTRPSPASSPRCPHCYARAPQWDGRIARVRPSVMSGVFTEPSVTPFRPRSSERPDKACSALADPVPLCWSCGAGCVPLHVALLLTGGPPRTQVLIDCVLTPQVHARPPDYKYLAVRPHRATPLVPHNSHTYPAHFSHGRRQSRSFLLLTCVVAVCGRSWSCQRASQRRLFPSAWSLPSRGSISR
jgi:hypothetical protein